MYTRKIVPFAALFIALYTGYVLGQNAESDADKFSEAVRAADRADFDGQGQDEANARLMDAYADMPGNLEVTKRAALIAQGKNGSGFTALIMQNQKLIEQNERIIALLEKQSKTK